MGIRVIHVLTHDSIGLGEDGPTHQPVEQMAALRAIPNLMMFRPADATETAECWQIALETQDRPSGIALTRQNLMAVRTEMSEKNLCARRRLRTRRRQGRQGFDLRLRLGSRDRRSRRSRAGRQGIAAALSRSPASSFSQNSRKTIATPSSAMPRSRSVSKPPSARAGRDHRFAWHLHRHEELRRFGSVQGTLQAFRHHGGSRGGSG